MFGNVLRTLGNERLHKYVEANDNMEIYGAFALTESKITFLYISSVLKI